MSDLYTCLYTVYWDDHIDHDTWEDSAFLKHQFNWLLWLTWCKSPKNNHDVKLVCKFYNNHYWLWLTWCKSLNNLIIPVLLLQLSPFCAQLLQPTVFLSDGSSHARNVTYQIDQIQSEDPTFRVRFKLPVRFFFGSKCQDKFFGSGSNSDQFAVHQQF